MAKVKMSEVTRFVADCVVAAGSPRQPAEQLADLLLAADKCGHHSHGLNRLQRYIHDISTGLCNPFNTPKIISETVSTAWVNANNGLGATAGNFSTELAIKKANDTGIGCVSVKGSNHFGISGYWANRISGSGMIGLVFTNGSPVVTPTRATKVKLSWSELSVPLMLGIDQDGMTLTTHSTQVFTVRFLQNRHPGYRQAAIGTNPLAVAGPGLPTTGPFYLDISSATVSVGKLEICRRRGIKLQPGWAQGPDGKETLDPDLAIKSGSLMPLGGNEKSGGYKGYGLGACVDLLSGILSGSHYGHHVPKWTPTVKVVADIGHTFLAINHKCFAPGFEERVSDVIQYWRGMKPADPKLPVLAPGDMEKMAMAEAESSGVLVYIEDMFETCDKLAAELNVEPIKRIKVS